MNRGENALLSAPAPSVRSLTSPIVTVWDEAVVSVKNGDLNHLHKKVWAAFTNKAPRDRPRDFLYAPMLESGDDLVSILVRSERLPSHLPHVRRRKMPRSGETASFRWLLRLDHKGSRTRRHTLYAKDEAVQCIGARLEESGLTLLGEPDMMQGCAGFRRDHLYTEILFWEAYGRFRMCDPECAGNMMLQGLGRMKGFGFGLLMFDLDAAG